MKKILRDNKGSISALVVISVLLYSIVLTTAYMKASGKRRIQIQSQILAKEAYEKQFNNLDEIREEIIGLPETNETQPYYPSSEFKQIKGTNLDNGLVIEDGNGNQYVWVEVPKNTTVYPTAGLNITNFTDDEYTKIENDLHTYTSVYRNGTTFTDTWVADNDNEGWFTESEYYVQKKKMLKSVYQNGGFYVGRYEAGIAVNRTSDTEEKSDGKYIAPTAVPVSKADEYPYTYVTRTQAKVLAEKVNSGSYTSSLMFGVQWDLILAFMHNKGNIDDNVLISDSSSIGNYKNNLWNIADTKTKYSTDMGKNFFACPYTKTTNSSVLLTTGANINFLVQNIYDISGNVWEWTLEYSADTSYPYTSRGSDFNDDGTLYSTAYRNILHSTNSEYLAAFGFRVSLF